MPRSTSRRSRSAAVITVLALIYLGGSGGARAQTPLGPEFRVNTFTTGDQFFPSVASDADGDVVVAWESFAQDGSNSGVFAQRYDATGTPVGSEFRVNTFTTANQSSPSVASDADGDFVVAWESFAQDGDADGIFAQRYDATGTAVGSEFRVNTFTTGDQTRPSVASDADGDFVVAWESIAQDGDNSGVFAQRYDATGTAVGSEFRVNTFTTGDQFQPAVAAAPDGDFVVAWTSIDQDGSGPGVFAQRYDPTGTPLGTEFRVNTFTTANQSSPSVASDADGDFVIAWHSDPQDGSSFEISAQRYDATGTPAGSEFRVNTFTTSDQRIPAVASDADGDIVVAWASFTQDGSADGIFAQRYDATGTPLGSEFRVNTFTTGNQTFPSVASDADGDIVVAWGGDIQDGSGFGIFAQRFAWPSSDLSVTKTARRTANSNRPFTYTITVASNGPDTATGVQLTDQLGENVTFVSASPPCTHDGGVVTCSLGSLNAGQSTTVTITVTVDPRSGTVTNTAQVTSNVTDPDPDNNTATSSAKVVGPKNPKP